MKNNLKFVKRNTNFVSEKCEMECEIRFKKKIGNFLKRITESVSHFSETEFVFRFTYISIFSRNGLCDPFQNGVKRILEWVS